MIIISVVPSPDKSRIMGCFKCFMDINSFNEIGRGRVMASFVLASDKDVPWPKYTVSSLWALLLNFYLFIVIFKIFIEVQLTDNVGLVSGI